MNKKQKCSEVQMTMHLLLVFVIGIFVGVSLISESDKLVSTIKVELTNSHENFHKQYEGYQENYDSLIQGYNNYKRYIYNGSEIKCIELNNYYIDNNTTNILSIDFLENFSKTPDVFMTVNGFYYKPHLALNDKLSQTLEFHLTDRKPSSFSFEIKTSIKDDEFFRLEDFDRIDVCYIAYIQYDKDDEEDNDKSDMIKTDD